MYIFQFLLNFLYISFISMYLYKKIINYNYIFIIQYLNCIFPHYYKMEINLGKY